MFSDIINFLLSYFSMVDSNLFLIVQVIPYFKRLLFPEWCSNVQFQYHNSGRRIQQMLNANSAVEKMSILDLPWQDPCPHQSLEGLVLVEICLSQQQVLPQQSSPHWQCAAQSSAWLLVVRLPQQREFRWYTCIFCSFQLSNTYKLSLKCANAYIHYVHDIQYMSINLRMRMGSITCWMGLLGSFNIQHLWELYFLEVFCAGFILVESYRFCVQTPVVSLAL